MAVDIQGFDIVFSSANANHARAIDQSIARMSEKVPTLASGIGDMAKALEAIGKINVDGVIKNIGAVKNSIDSIDGKKLVNVFELANSKSEVLLNTVTSLVNMLGKVEPSTLGGNTKWLSNNNVNNIVGMAIMVENAIVFGNKYRSTYPEVDRDLSNAEFSYINGEYTKALTMAISCMETLFPNTANEKILENK